MQNNTFVKDLLFESLAEKRKSRIWSIIFYFILFISVFLVFFFISNLFKFNNNKNVEHVAIVSLNGSISDNSLSSAKNIIKSLNEAFYNRYSKAIILKINSPGGSPVQSNMIYNHIKRLRKIGSKPIYAVIEDVGASGAYLVAVAAEKVYCDQFSIVGSIGVLINSFGFVEAINKLGIERRLYKSGKHKSILDPFLERNIEDDKILQHSLDVIHEGFINIVKRSRYSSTIVPDHNIFSGRFWVGEDALALGLVDGFYDIYSLSFDVIKVKSLVDYNVGSGILSVFNRK